MRCDGEILEWLWLLSVCRHDVIADGVIRATLYRQSSWFPIDQLLNALSSFSL